MFKLYVTLMIHLHLTKGEQSFFWCTKNTVTSNVDDDDDDNRKTEKKNDNSKQFQEEIIIDLDSME
ncbi:hypothetical protein DERF_008364 [Dermatophagoides farinae]|uniref:Uncharacterized protein n=1 Tax=Dermatophagoides farinae TaxID=6954 RepID=A0A922L932_DERFA|nr:hypothetical protein DERF_008364 [Dermatophagoides farinae]